MPALLIRLTALFILAAVMETSFAHEARPAHLEVDVTEADLLNIHWTRPLRDGRVLPVEPGFPERCELRGRANILQLPTVVHESWQLDCGKDALTGEQIKVKGLHLVISDVLLRYRDAEGREHFRILDKQDPVFVIPGDDYVDINVAPYYFRLGIEHILTGPDHLLFVLALLLLVSGLWRLLKTITAFTLAHSITLGAAILGYVNVPSPPVEAIIALSIVFLARELLSKVEGNMTLRSPWLIAAIFGLVHGLGFAGGLSEIGLPEGEIPLALLMFNLGVEAGQVGFILLALLLFEILRKLEYGVAPLMEKSSGYAIGAMGAFWLVDRVQGFY